MKTQDESSLCLLFILMLGVIKSSFSVCDKVLKLCELGGELQFLTYGVHFCQCLAMSIGFCIVIA